MGSRSGCYIAVIFACLLLATKINAGPPLVKLPDAKDLPAVTDLPPITKMPDIITQLLAVLSSCEPKCDKKCQYISEEQPELPCLRVCMTCCLMTDGCVPFKDTGVEVTCTNWGQVVLSDVIAHCP